jgi:hypothetical protein
MTKADKALAELELSVQTIGAGAITVSDGVVIQFSVEKLRELLANSEAAGDNRVTVWIKQEDTDPVPGIVLN